MNTWTLNLCIGLKEMTTIFGHFRRNFLDPVLAKPSIKLVFKNIDLGNNTLITQNPVSIFQIYPKN